MRVGLVVYGSIDARSGGFRYDRQLRDHLESLGHRVDVIELPWRSYLRGLLAGIDPRRRDPLHGGDAAISGYDVVFQDELCHPSLLAQRRTCAEGPCVISLVHLLRSGPQSGPARPFYRAVERRYLETVDGVVCTSADTVSRVDSLVDLPTVVAPPAGRCQGAAVTADQVRDNAYERELHVGFVGNVVPRKGLETLLAAIDRVDAPTRLTVIGDLDVAPGYAGRQQARLERSPPADDVRLLGTVSDDRLETELERFHVLAVPSRYESVGMVYLEAMEYGTVPIASTVGGADEFVTDRHDGLLVRPDDPDGLAQHLSWLATDRAALARLGTNALSTAGSRPDWESSMDRIVEFVDQLRSPETGEVSSSTQRPLERGRSP